MLGALFALAGCGDSGAGPGAGPLAVDSTRPTNVAVGVDVGTTVRAYFNRALNPASVSAATFLLNDGAVDLPGRVSYDALKRAALLSGPTLPGGTYQARLLTGIQDASGSALPAVGAWTFTTRTWEAAAVDQSGTVGQYTSLAIDGTGRLHVSYYDITNGDLKYATCASSCTTATNWQTVAVDQPVNVGQFTSLAVDATGRLDVAYYDVTNADLKYATCMTSCATAASWQTVAIDQAGDVGKYASLAVDAAGGLHVGYYDQTNLDLKYATCMSSCTTAGNWQRVAVDQPQDFGRFTSLLLDATGRLHISYALFFGSTTGGGLKYATCVAACTVGGNWHIVSIEIGVLGDATSLAVDGSGQVHIAYTYFLTSPGYGSLGYATCVSSCGTATNWHTLLVGGSAGTAISLRADAMRRLHVVTYDWSLGDLTYATCATDCLTAANWRFARGDQAGSVGSYASMVVDAAGAIHSSYFDATNHQLKYIR